MLHLAVFMFLNCAVCEALGRQDDFSSSISNEESRLNPNWYVDGLIIPNSEPDFGYGIKDETSPSSKLSEFPLSLWRSPTGKNGPPCIQQFSNNFVEKVIAYEKLRKAFQVHQFNAKSLCSVYNDYVVDRVSSIGALDAPVTARVFTFALENNFHKLKKDDLLRVYGDSIADYLYFRGCLNPSNAEFLAQVYFMFTEKRINSVDNPSPERNIRAIVDALIAFLSSQGLINPTSTARISEVFLNRLYEL